MKLDSVLCYQYKQFEVVNNFQSYLDNNQHIKYNGSQEGPLHRRNRLHVSLVNPSTE